MNLFKGPLDGGVVSRPMTGEDGNPCTWFVRHHPTAGWALYERLVERWEGEKRVWCYVFVMASQIYSEITDHISANRLNW